MPLKTHLDEQPTLNLTSMLDVVFLLIIFFMVGTQFTDPERSVGLKVPEVSEVGALTAAPERKVINVYADGQLKLDEQAITLEQLTATLQEARSQYQDLGVLVRGDARCPFQWVAEVLNACRRAGIADLGISVKIVRRAE